jgi:hypothetical protein
VLALVAAILLMVELATFSYLWVNHVQASPATPTLQCADVDPFTCHEAADKAIAMLRQLIPAARHRGMPSIARVEVQSGGAELMSVVRPSPLPVVLEPGVSWRVMVTVRYAGGRVSDDVGITRCNDGRDLIVPYEIPTLLGFWTCSRRPG